MMQFCRAAGRMLRPVGILGGMGPGATVLLMQRVMAVVRAGEDADHIPLIVHQNPQVPSRIHWLIEGAGEDPGPVLAAMAVALERAGAEALAMPCNTAHHFAPAIRAAVGLPLIDMVARAVAHAAMLAGGGGKVGILGSPALRRIGLFDAPLRAAGMVPVYPEDEAGLLGAIRGIKAGGDLAAAQTTVRAASERLLTGGVPVQMIACTEFSMLADPFATGAAGFDTLDLLVAGIAEFARGDGQAGPGG
jgi:aspartate racemase